jgi:hypothetical protein
MNSNKVNLLETSVPEQVDGQANTTIKRKITHFCYAGKTELNI